MIRIANSRVKQTYKLVTPTSSNEWFDRMQLNAESFHRGMTLVLGERLIVSLSGGRQDRWYDRTGKKRKKNLTWSRSPLRFYSLERLKGLGRPLNVRNMCVTVWYRLRIYNIKYWFHNCIHLRFYVMTKKSFLFNGVSKDFSFKLYKKLSFNCLYLMHKICIRFMDY